jgi:hypothetical protein
MFRSFVAPLATTMLVVACASAGAEEDGASEDSVVSGESKPGKVGADAGDAGDAATTDTGSDAGLVPGHAATSSSLEIDDRACTVHHASLFTGLDTHGWTLTFEGTCPDEIHVVIAGTDDRAYPQTATKPFGLEDGAYLLRSPLDSPTISRSFTAAEGGSVSIASGPTRSTPKTVVGTAIVGELGRTHSLRFRAEY